MVAKTKAMILEQKDINGYPLALLTPEEKEVLYKMFNVKRSLTSDEEVAKKIGKLLLPAWGFLQNDISYKEMILKIAKKRNINLGTTTSLYDNEQKLFLEIFKDNFNEMNANEKEEFLKDLEQKGLSKDQVASVAAITTLGVAQLSGFGVYLLASSTVGAITSALGITLSFGFYTAMSSFISYAIGPIGFAIAAIPLYKSFKDVRSIDDLKNKLKVLYKDGGTFLKGNYDGAELIVKYFASLRIMKIREQELQIENNNIVHTQSFDEIKSLEEIMIKDIASSAELSKEISDLEFQLNALRKEQNQLKEKESLNRKEKAGLLDIQANLFKKNEQLKNAIENLKKDINLWQL